ncbi:MAG: acyl carrier protein [Ruminococcaceae bacterium]|nr:acyl carrier protein [Oscillospiraceae bacterium]
MIFDRVREIISKEFEIDEQAVTPETLLTDDLDADSLEIIDLVMSLEDEFGMEVPDEAVQGFKTVGDIAKYIEEN